MALSTRWGIVLSLLLFAARCTAQSITTTAAAAKNSSFMGYYISPDEKSEPLFAQDKWTTSGTYAGNCADSATCILPVTCQSTEVSYNNGDSRKCIAGLSCLSFTIFQTSPGGAPSATNYFCGTSWPANTIYRELATSTASTSPSTSNTSSEPVSRSSGKAWIAGVVVGPVAALAIIALGFYVLRKRRRTTPPPAPASALESNQGMRYVDDHSHTKPELDATTIASPRHIPVELDSDMHHSRHAAELS